MNVIVTIVIGLICFLFGVASLLLLCCFLGRKERNRRKRKVKVAEKGQKKPFLSRFGVMNLILVIIGITLLVFTIVMIDLFKNYGTIPDTLVTCVFGVLGTECGAMAWIKTSKEKHRDRKIELEDRKHYEDREKAALNSGNNETEVM